MVCTCHRQICRDRMDIFRGLYLVRQRLSSCLYRLSKSSVEMTLVYPHSHVNLLHLFPGRHLLAQS